MDFSSLKAEIAKVDYDGMTDAEIVTALNAADISTVINPLIVSGSAIYNAVVPAEFQALATAQQQLVRDIFGLGDAIDASTGTNVRDVLLAIFGTGTTTRTNLTALATKLVSRAEELGFGRVLIWHIETARALP